MSGSFAADGAGGIDAGTGFVDNDVNQLGKTLGDQLRDDLLNVPASGAIANGDYAQLVFADKLLQFGLRFRPGRDSWSCGFRRCGC